MANSIMLLFIGTFACILINLIECSSFGEVNDENRELYKMLGNRSLTFNELDDVLSAVGNKEIKVGTLSVREIRAMKDYNVDDCREDEISHRLYLFVRENYDNIHVASSYFKQFATLCARNSQKLADILARGISTSDKETVVDFIDRLALNNKLEWDRLKQTIGGFLDSSENQTNYQQKVEASCKRIQQTLEIVWAIELYSLDGEANKSVRKLLSDWELIHDTCRAYSRVIEQRANAN